MKSLTDGKSMYSGSDTSSICASSGSPPGSNLAVDEIMDWAEQVAPGSVTQRVDTLPHVEGFQRESEMANIQELRGIDPYWNTSPQTAPPKKKRTRTLTTPHQSAVLHALLAQSRFPTTAMREEVGRSTGLSARKVQNQHVNRSPESMFDYPYYKIWFQNQRQKARRPGQPSPPPDLPSSGSHLMLPPSAPAAPLHASFSASAFGHNVREGRSY
ncbi:hypothetical protein B0H19DRAFT_1365316 [Mycena capillaripes]|nr:hypothetical protein B0H19DRAFT_1365316 [Mycena capillaripes]